MGNGKEKKPKNRTGKHAFFLIKKKNSKLLPKTEYTTQWSSKSEAKVGKKNV